MSEQVVVAGSGIAGMCSALALSRRGFPVTLIERDPPPPDGDADRAFFEWARRGASQFRHPHAFLGLMCNLLQDNYPDLLEDFYAAGARRLELGDMLSPELASRYRPEPGDEKLWMLLCRRATIETVLRRYVGRIEGIRILNELHVDGVLTGCVEGQTVVRGLKVRRDCVERFGPTIEADIVVDASGRTTKFPRWFGEVGIDVREENDDAEIVYYTRHYRFRPGVAEPDRTGPDRPSGDLGYLKFGVFPGDNGHFAVIVCVHNSETELRAAVKDGEKFDAICRSIPGLAPWVDPDKVDATTYAFGIGDIRAVWRHYVEDGAPKLLNFFAVGDAAIRTNPLYGRGCSIGILHAHLLADVLAETDDAVARALAYDERTEAQVRPIFATSLSEDRNGIRRALAVAEGQQVDRADSFGKWFGLAFGDALAAAARYDLRVYRGMMRTVNLMESPGEFLKDPLTRLKILSYMFRGRTRNAGSRIVRGPSRQEMLALVSSTDERRSQAQAAA